jgi:hypothetical protein
MALPLFQVQGNAVFDGVGGVVLRLQPLQSVQPAQEGAENLHGAQELVPAMPRQIPLVPAMPRQIPVSPPQPVEVVKAIKSGNLEVHQSKTDMNAAQIGSFIAYVQRSLQLSVGVHAGWSTEAQTKFDEWLHAAKKARKGPLMLENMAAPSVAAGQNDPGQHVAASVAASVAVEGVQGGGSAKPKSDTNDSSSDSSDSSDDSGSSNKNGDETGGGGQSEKASDSEEEVAQHAEGGHYVQDVGAGSSFVDKDADIAASVALREGQDGHGKKLVNPDGSLIQSEPNEGGDDFPYASLSFEELVEEMEETIEGEDKLRQYFHLKNLVAEIEKRHKK